MINYCCLTTCQDLKWLKFTPLPLISNNDYKISLMYFHV